MVGKRRRGEEVGGEKGAFKLQTDRHGMKWQQDEMNLERKAWLHGKGETNESI